MDAGMHAFLYRSTVPSSSWGKCRFVEEEESVRIRNVQRAFFRRARTIAHSGLNVKGLRANDIVLPHQGRAS